MNHIEDDLATDDDNDQSDSYSDSDESSLCFSLPSLSGDPNESYNWQC